MRLSIWTPRSRFDGVVHTDYCRWAVHELGRGVGFHQCGRKRKREVEGYGLCEQHAREAEMRLGLRERPKRPPTAFERELAANEHRRKVRDALLEACEAALIFATCAAGGVQGSARLERTLRAAIALAKGESMDRHKGK